MIDMTYDYAAEQLSVCECGDPECIGPAETVQAIVETLVLDSLILRLVKERNEARELVSRMLSVADRGTGEEEYFKAMLAAFTAVQAWKGGAK